MHQDHEIVIGIGFDAHEFKRLERLEQLLFGGKGANCYTCRIKYALWYLLSAVENTTDWPVEGANGDGVWDETDD